MFSRLQIRTSLPSNLNLRFRGRVLAPRIIQVHSGIWQNTTNCSLKSVKSTSQLSQRRHLTTSVLTNVIEYISHIHPALIPPTVFTSLIIILWTWKCVMMIIFQNKIIYMPGVPLNARHEKIEQYESLFQGINWREDKSGIRTVDGHKLSVVIGEVKAQLAQTTTSEKAKSDTSTLKRKRIIIVYLQGNASSTPPRLPALSSILVNLSRQISPPMQEVTYTFVVPSYRGYWGSTGRPSQPGIEKDGQAILEYISEKRYIYNSTEPELPEEDVKVILWGQSIGANISATILANYLQHHHDTSIPLLDIPALILETPFLSIKYMLQEELYPQKWLPYRYLTPFLRNLWDIQEASERIKNSLRLLSAKKEQEYRFRGLKRILIISAEKDELVSERQVDLVERVLREHLHLQNGDSEKGWNVVGIDRVVVNGALHVECMFKDKGRRAVVKLLREVGSL